MTSKPELFKTSFRGTPIDGPLHLLTDGRGKNSLFDWMHQSIGFWGDGWQYDSTTEVYFVDRDPRFIHIFLDYLSRGEVLKSRISGLDAASTYDLWCDARFLRIPFIEKLAAATFPECRTCGLSCLAKLCNQDKEKKDDIIYPECKRIDKHTGKLEEFWVNPNEIKPTEPVKFDEKTREPIGLKHGDLVEINTRDGWTRWIYKTDFGSYKYIYDEIYRLTNRHTSSFHTFDKCSAFRAGEVAAVGTHTVGIPTHATFVHGNEWQRPDNWGKHNIWSCCRGTESSTGCQSFQEHDWGFAKFRRDDIPQNLDAQDCIEAEKM